MASSFQGIDPAVGRVKYPETIDILGDTFYLSEQTHSFRTDSFGRGRFFSRARYASDSIQFDMVGSRPTSIKIHVAQKWQSYSLESIAALIIMAMDEYKRTEKEASRWSKIVEADGEGEFTDGY